MKRPKLTPKERRKSFLANCAMRGMSRETLRMKWPLKINRSRSWRKRCMSWKFSSKLWRKMRRNRRNGSPNNTKRTCKPSTNKTMKRSERCYSPTVQPVTSTKSESKVSYLLLWRNEPFPQGIIKTSRRKSLITLTEILTTLIKALRPLRDKETDQHLNPQRLRNQKIDQRTQVPKSGNIKQVRSV